MLENFENIHDYEIVMGGDWNLIFNKDLDAKNGNPALKLQSIAELSKIINTFKLCDIFRLRHPHKKTFSFRRPTPMLWRRLDFFLISGSLRDSVNKTGTLASIAKCDHSPVTIDFSPVCQSKPGPSYWKFNTSLINEEGFCSAVSQIIAEVKTNNQEMTHQLKWELTKYKIREFCMKFSKQIAKDKKRKINKSGNNYCRLRKQCQRHTNR